MCPVVTRGAPIADATIVAIGLHGRALGATSAIELADRLSLPGVAFVIPEADARSWYPQSFLAPLAANQPHLDHALARVTELVDGLALPRQRIFVIGFSQGACLALEWLSRAPRSIGGVIAFTGGLIGPPGTTWPTTAIADTPVLLTTSDIDEWVPLDEIEQAAEILYRLAAAG